MESHPIQDSKKYLGIKIDMNFTRCHYITNVATKLNKASAILSKIRHFVNFKTCISIYCGIFEISLKIFTTCLEEKDVCAAYWSWT